MANLKPLSLLRYWRNSLADSEKISSMGKEKDSNLHIPYDLLRMGRIPAEQVLPLFKKRDNFIKSQTKNQKAGGKQDPIQTKSIKILVSPYVAKRKYEHSIKEKSSKDSSTDTIYPLLIPAITDREGRLHPNLDLPLPWIDRRFLAPTDGDHVELGTMETADEFLVKFELPANDDKPLEWSNLWEYAHKLLDFVTKIKDSETNFKIAEYEMLLYAYFQADDEVRGSSSQVIQLYDYLDNRYSDSKDKLPATLSNYLNPDEITQTPSLKAEAIFQNSKQHLGYLSVDYGLTESQRKALSHFFTMKAGDILAINGPPGTGKTTLLQSVISSLWIKAALDKSKPPIIVASSTNNQAITNIIESFSIPAKGPNFRQRWLPNCDSLALYLVSKSGLEKAQKTGYICGIRDKSFELVGNISTLTDSDIWENSKQKYLENVSDYFNKKHNTLAEASKSLHQELAKTHQEFSEQFTTILKLKALMLQGGETKLKLDISALQKTIHENEVQLEQTKKINRDWQQLLLDKISRLQTFSWIPFFGRRFKLKQQFLIHNFIEDHHLEIDKDNSTHHDLTNLLSSKCKQLNTNVDQAKASLSKINNKLSEFKKLQQQWQKLDTKNQANLASSYDFAATDNPLNILDTTLRVKMFFLALHYWEGEWLTAIKKTHNYNFKQRYSLEASKELWQRYAMLLPCFVTTMQSGVKFFKYSNAINDFRYTTDMIDLLIIDEAGQVDPALAAGMVSLSKKVLFVGDCLQLEPIPKLPTPVDFANAKKHDLCNNMNEFNLLKNIGILVSGAGTHTYGNAMSIAQRRCAYIDIAPDGKAFDQRGLFLLEHWRCAPEIIQYCNTLAYHGYLFPKRESLKDHPIPSMGYAHIDGDEVKAGSSRKNKIEADVIADWIAKNSTMLLKQYPKKKSIAEIVGIVTPFAAQKRTLFASLRSKQIKLSDNKVGTVHSFQGAQMPVIIFSPTYSSNSDSKSYFFDAGINMLNVAISRAEDSFLVFGDMGIFNPDLQKPSGLLAKHLFSSPDNEITDVHIPVNTTLSNSETQLINTREGHRSILQESFMRAKNRLVIVSPYISIYAIQGNNIPELIKSNPNSNSNRKIIVYTDLYFNLDSKKQQSEHKEWRNNSTAGIALLRELGVEIRVVKQIHSKQICIDSHTLVQGSYNWLSAVTNDNSRFANQESSFVYTGYDVEDFITQTLQALQARENINGVRPGLLTPSQ